MRGIGGLVVIVLVATHTGIWSRCVIPVMTEDAVICDTGMSALQSIVIVVNVKSSRSPSRFSGMTVYAGLRNPYGCMAGIRGQGIFFKVAG